jgi:hypothetical protein
VKKETRRLRIPYTNVPATADILVFESLDEAVGSLGERRALATLNYAFEISQMAEERARLSRQYRHGQEARQ